jgi:hypothetical protein
LRAYRFGFGLNGTTGAVGSAYEAADCVSRARRAGNRRKVAAMPAGRSRFNQIAVFLMLLLAACAHDGGASVASGSAPKWYTDPGTVWAP